VRIEFLFPVYVFRWRLTLKIGYGTGSEANCTSGMCCRTNNPNSNSPNHTLLPAPRYGWFQWYVSNLALGAEGPTDVCTKTWTWYRTAIRRSHSLLPYLKLFPSLLERTIRVSHGPYIPVTLSLMIRRINYLGESCLS
jgi:hypothetical protein